MFDYFGILTSFPGALPLVSMALLRSSCVGSVSSSVITGSI